MKSKILKSISMIHEDIVEIIFHDDMVFSMEDMKTAYEEYDEFTGGKRLKRLVVVGKHSAMSKEVRKYGEAENERRKDNCIAEAMVVHNFVQKMCTNFYLKYIRDIYPARSFTDIEEAKQWLMNFREEAIQVPT
jgi:hypothetical protein